MSKPTKPRKQNPRPNRTPSTASAKRRISDEEAYSQFRALRFSQNNGEPFCPKCGCVAVYEFKSRKIFKCEGCEGQFSATSGTIFASRKLDVRTILAGIAIFVNGAKGYSALQLSRDLDVHTRRRSSWRTSSARCLVSSKRKSAS